MQIEELKPRFAEIGLDFEALPKDIQNDMTKGLLMGNVLIVGRREKNVAVHLFHPKRPVSFAFERLFARLATNLPPTP